MPHIYTKDTSDNDAGRVVVSDVIPFPETWYSSATAQAGDAVDNTPYGAIDVSDYEGVVFMNTVGEVTIQGSIDGTNYEAIDLYFEDMGAIDATAEARQLVTTTVSGTGFYLIKTPFKTLRFLNGTAVQSTVRYARVGKLQAI